jgi:hypothetical protein
MENDEFIGEIWAVIDGFGDYQISNLGRVKSFKSRRRPDGRILKLSPNTHGYFQVFLRRDGKLYGFHVHKLVAQAFIGPYPKGKEVNHKNCIKTDNQLSNLEYKTPRQNLRHAIKNGRLIKGSGFAMSKLQEADVPIIRDLLRAGLSERRIAARFGVTRNTITSIKQKRSWRHIR